jgi:two-component system, sensor histidine kinase and response regulator
MLFDTLVTLFAETSRERPVLAPEIDGHARRLRGLRVLVAEDNEINQQIAVELLEGAGATVALASDGLEAVRKLMDQSPPSNYDVVLMDLQMPEMDGYQATSKIRSDPRFATFPIIAMTGPCHHRRATEVSGGRNGWSRVQTYRSIVTLRHVGALRRSNCEGS